MALLKSSDTTLAEAVQRLEQTDIQGIRSERQELLAELETLRRKWKDLQMIPFLVYAYIPFKNRAEWIGKLHQIDAIQLELSERAGAVKEVLSKLENFPSIKALQKENNDLLRACLAELLSDLALFLNLNNTLSVEQINQVSQAIIAECKGLTLEDIAICLNKGKTGKYGQVFRLDGAVILAWLDKYKQERQEQWMNRKLNNHLRTKESGHSERGSVRHFSKIKI